MPKIAAADVDLASEEPVIHFVGEPAPGDVPQRDLNAADLAYIHRVRALQKSGGEPVDPARPMDMAAVANDLLATGAFSARAKAAPKPKAAKPARKPKPAPAAPAAPAEEN